LESSNTLVQQMTEMFQWPKCLRKNDRNLSAKKKRLQLCRVHWKWTWITLDFGFVS